MKYFQRPVSQQLRCDGNEPQFKVFITPYKFNSLTYKNVIIFSMASNPRLNDNVYFKRLALHEFGHLIGNLVDEYNLIKFDSESRKFVPLTGGYVEPGVNCNTPEKADKIWTALGFPNLKEYALNYKRNGQPWPLKFCGACTSYDQCNLVIRPSFNSIMNEIDTDTNEGKYNDLSLKVVEKALQRYAG
jgi:hypothetical protein